MSTSSPSLASTSTSPSTSTPHPRKLSGYDFYREILKSPKLIVAPMVDQSELAYRRLCREYGAELVYTPMINAKMFTDATNKSYRHNAFDIVSGEEGAYTDLSTSAASSTIAEGSYDRPLVVQFCANDPEKLLQSAKMVEEHCDAVDINLGCPQDIAKRGRYGSFLQDDWDLIYRLINILHTNLSIPVTAKFRIFDDVEKTVEYAKMLERAGAQILTCHGRIREQRGVNTGLASWRHIKAVKESVSVPVFANGNILFRDDVQRCLDATGCDGVMSAEGVLYNPALFVGLNDPSTSLPLTTTNPPIHTLAARYLELLTTQTTKTPVSAVKGHLFKILRPGLSVKGNWDLRDRLGKVGVKSGGGAGGAAEDREIGGVRGVKWVKECVDIVEEIGRRNERDAAELTQNGAVPLEDLIKVDEKSGLRVLPYWLAQPYFRAAPPPNANANEKKKKKVQVVVVKGREAPDVMEVNRVGVNEQVRAKRSIEDLVLASDVEEARLKHEHEERCEGCTGEGCGKNSGRVAVAAAAVVDDAEVAVVVKRRRVSIEGEV
ncbi:Dus-domain-containing protein [Coprinopsis marcescibilis]|uniref:tRNA-dihydrouridine(16/17) synthase [NAD(P)(+)] n=1 Tax=Coprinopsis marcescibilis TaxID=230819 RepID=A0A5C3KIG5_COPMA|nr:Dus-domain-containing protein [Coprinopsis marcescibilis]